MNYKGFPLILKRALAVFILIPMIGQAQGKCPKADGLSATTTETSAELSWTGGSDVVNYQVDVKHGPGTSAYSYSTTTAELTAKVEGLEPGRAYRFRVKTKCEKGSGGSSQWADFTTAGDPTSEVEEAEDDKDKNNGPCPKATNLAILEIDDTSATLGWLGNEKNVSYLVDVHQKEHTPTYKISETVDTTIIFIEGLIPGGNYKFRVKSKCEKNSGGSSSWINFTTTGGDTTFQQCPKATNLSVPEVTDTSALLKWIARDSAELFTVEVKSFGQTASFKFDTTLVEDSLWIDGLEPDGDYHFRVLVTCKDGSTSGSSDWSKFRTLSDAEANPDEEIDDPNGDPSGAGEQDTSSVVVSSEIATFPNPATENFTVELPTAELGYLTYVTLTDLTGRVVYSTKIDGVPDADQLPISVGDLRDGIYKLVIRSVDFHKTKTILIQQR